MIRIIALFAALSATAAAQTSPVTYDAGKLLALAPGQWSYVPTASGTEARYGGYLTIRCDRATRTVTILRPGVAPTELTVVTDSMTRNLPAGGRLLASDTRRDRVQ